jgi:hypothetical protein
MKTSSLKLGLVALAALASAGAAHADRHHGKGFFGNVVRLEQNGRGNGAAQAQNGAGNASAISQTGVANTGTTSQTGANNAAMIQQKGANNTAGITQTGDGNAACIIQVGKNLSAETIQTGGQSSGLFQTKKGVADIGADICMAGDKGAYSLMKKAIVRTAK